MRFEGPRRSSKEKENKKAKESVEIEDSGPGRGWALWPQRKDPRKRLGCAK